MIAWLLFSFMFFCAAHGLGLNMFLSAFVGMFLGLLFLGYVIEVSKRR